MFLKGIHKITFRNLKKNTSTTTIKILGLVISIASAIIIWLYVINENKYDKGIPNSDRIFRLEADWASMPPLVGHLLNQNITDQVIATRLNYWKNVGIQVNSTPFNLRDLAFVDSTFFKTFHLETIVGNPEEALHQPLSLVLTESLAKRIFGSIDIIGKIVRFENQFDFTVTAIIKDQPFLHFKIDALASIVSLEQIDHKGLLQNFDGWDYPTYLLIRDGKLTREYGVKINALLKKFGYNHFFRLRPFNDIYYSPEIENESNTKHGNLLYNKILISVSIFILLLAAINFINLTIANAITRSKEVRIKKLQGANMFHLILQFVFETTLLILISLMISFILLWFLNPLLSSLTGYPVQVGNLCTTNNILLFGGGLITFIIITGIYPSLYISSYNINTNKERLSGYSKHSGFRNGLIIFQNLVSITLICCTLIANKQFQYMNKKDLGFEKKGLVSLNINSQVKDHLDLFKDKLLKYPEISSVSFSSRIPGNYWGSWCCINIEGKENKYFNNYVDADYLKTMGIRIKEGRNFSADNPGDNGRTFLINETAIKQYDLKNPLGDVVTFFGKKGQIIGIIHDFHQRGLNYEKTPLLLFYIRDDLNFINIKLANNNIPGALERIKETWEEICPAFPFEYSFMDETYNLQYKSENKFKNLLFSFALLSVFIASIGLFGLSIYSSELRTKEIGMRRINGARVREIIIMLNKDFVKWVVLAFALSCPITWYVMQKWLNNFAYKTDISLWIFALAGLIALGIALLTVSWQTWRGATKNPVDALRYE